jgi:hypothetical protein
MTARVFSSLRRPRVVQLVDRPAIVSWTFVSGGRGRPERLECSVAYEAIGFRRETTVEVGGESEDCELNHAERRAIDRAMLDCARLPAPAPWR